MNQYLPWFWVICNVLQYIINNVAWSSSRSNKQSQLSTEQRERVHLSSSRSFGYLTENLGWLWILYVKPIRAFKMKSWMAFERLRKKNRLLKFWWELNFLQNESTHIIVLKIGSEHSLASAHVMTFNLTVSSAEQICGTSATQSSFNFNFIFIFIFCLFSSFRRESTDQQMYLCHVSQAYDERIKINCLSFDFVFCFPSCLVFWQAEID